MSGPSDNLENVLKLSAKLESELSRLQAQSSFCLTFQGIIHSLKNSLAGISTASEYIYMVTESMTGQKLRDPEPRNRDLHEIAHFASGITRSTSDMSKMVMALLDKAGRDHSNEVEETELNSILQNELLFIRLQDEFRVGSVGLKENFSDKKITLKVIPHHISQIFNNLLFNALEELRSSDDGMIEVSTFCNETHVGFEVKDNGPGIDETVLPNIFDPLFTSKAATAKSVMEGGSGLGLFSCRQLAKKYGGTIEVDHQLNPGCIFRVVFPVSDSNESGEVD